jgi:hypothetical protein
MINQKLIALIGELIKLTQQSNIDWVSGGSPEVYIAAFTNYGVSISSNEHDDDSPSLSVFNKDGDKIEGISRGELSRNSLRAASNNLNELYMLARSSALGVDAALDDLLSELKSKDIPF